MGLFFEIGRGLRVKAFPRQHFVDNLLQCNAWLVRSITCLFLGKDLDVDDLDFRDIDFYPV